MQRDQMVLLVRVAYWLVVAALVGVLAYVFIIPGNATLWFTPTVLVLVTTGILLSAVVQRTRRR
jgi:hypothetical protein